VITKFRQRKEAMHSARSVKKISRYWSEFRADFVPPDTPPLVLNLIQLAFYWGALMTLFYRRDVMAVVPVNERDTVMECYRREVDLALYNLHGQRRSMQNKSTVQVSGPEELDSDSYEV
jgi:hypothetical protein